MTREHAIRGYSLVIECLIYARTEQNFLYPRNFSTKVTIFPSFITRFFVDRLKSDTKTCATKAAARLLSYTDSQNCLWPAIFQIRVSFFSRPAARRGKSREMAERVFN